MSRSSATNPVRRLVKVIVAIAVLTASCTGVEGIGGGNVIPPESGDPVVHVVVLAADDLGVLDAAVTVDGVSLPRGSEGDWSIVWEQQPVALSVSAEGFQPFDHVIERYPEGGRVEFRLEPVLLTGRITTHDGRPLPGAGVELNGRTDTTDNEGRYALERATPGTITISRPAWQTREQEWDGGVAAFDIAMDRLEIRAIRASIEDLGDPRRWRSMLDLAATSGINGVVVDLKTDDGTVTYASQVPLAVSSGAVNAAMDIDAVLSHTAAGDLYTIGRVVAFQDDFATAVSTEHAVTHSDGSLWRSPAGRAWLDPSDPAAYEYPIAIAEEACMKGFDEIQFDFVSFPIGDLSDARFDAEYDQETRVGAVTAFLERAYSVLHPRCAVSATVLGIVLESGSDEGVGQRPSAMSRTVDVLSPTLYTTNYGSGWKNWDDPDAHAVELVTSALDGGVPRLDGFAYMRPWLQTWGIDVVDQRAVQSAVTDEGMGFLLWSNNGGYTTDNVPPR